MWFGAKDGILAVEQLVRKRQVESPEALNDITGRPGKGTWFRIMFTKIFNNKIMTGGMTVSITGKI